ncbi:PREDICTED: LOW QUALITY PROTEIN: BUD13 homolog [Dufourea novaeangliae]|nr:PREDICTED: LOW QUALITY PROTEIN: BUD13 homolog [Dufourea novaeangliae]
MRYTGYTIPLYATVCDKEMEKKVIDQKEYLRKYLSSGNDEDKKKKKKKKKLKVGPQTVKVIDDDIDLKNMRPVEENEFDIFIYGEDAPQIAGIVDERGPVDFSDKRRWKIIADSEGGDLTVTSHNRETKQSRKDKENYDHDLSPPRTSYKKHTKLVDKTSESNSDSNNDLEADISPHKYKKKGKRKQKASDSDLSPPRQRKNKNYDSDLSPPRKNKSKNDDSDLSPPRKTTRSKYYDSDLSPPRKTKSKNHDSDLSPPRKNKKHKKHGNKSDSDMSPPRKSRKDSDSDLSPPRNKTKNYDSDLSPPRKSKKDEYEKRKSHSESRKQRKVSDTDLSPPRRSEKYMDSHLSSKQRYRNDDSDLSPPRQSRKHKHRDSHANVDKESRNYKHSSKRSEGRHDSDASPPGKKNRGRSGSQSKEDNRDFHKNKNKRNNKYEYENYHKREKSTRGINDHKKLDARHRDDREDNEKRMKKTLDGKKAGLQDAKALREETEAYKKREAEHFSKLSKEVTGIGQAAIMRDSKTGRKRNLKAEAAEAREKEKRQTELDEKYAKWGKGLKQVEDREEKLKDDLYEMSKPLARYADDADLDRRLREQEREGDPMLEYIKQKQIKEGKISNNVIIIILDRPTYEGSYMPNRFGIKPGYRWDGVDRSNGYEKRWFETQNAKTAQQEEAYKWSTSDM